MSKNPGRLKLAVGIPAYGGQITAHQARQWCEFGNTLGASMERFELVSFDFYDVNGIDQCRNLMLARAMEIQADWLLMIDADTWVAPSSNDYVAQCDAGFLILRMISEAAHAGAAVVVAPVMSRVIAGDDKDSHAMIYEIFDGESKQVSHRLSRNMIPIDRAATAVFALDVRFANEHKLSFKFEGAMSEDHYYCKHVREHDGVIFADPRVRTGHMSRQAPLFSDGAQ